MATESNRCEAKRADGQPCRAQALPSGYCWAHDPRLADKRARARRQGGKNSAKVVRLRGLMPGRLVPAFQALEKSLTELHDGALDPRVATAMAAVARAMCALAQTGELEERVRLLERSHKGA